MNITEMDASRENVLAYSSYGNISSLVKKKRNQKFFKNLKIEKDLDAVEETLLEIAEASARSHGFDNLLAYLSGIPEEVLRRQVKLRQEAKKRGIDSKEFFDFLRFLHYIKKLAIHRPVNVDQINDILIAGNTTTLRVEELFNAGELIAQDGVRLNGLFGKQGMVKKEQDLKEVDDLMPFLYIMNSTIKHNNPLPEYFLFFGETPNPISGKRTDEDKFFLEFNSGPWFNANLALARAEKFLDEAIGMSLDVIPSPMGVIVVDQDEQPHIIPIVAAIYDLENMTLWKVERSPLGILAYRLDEWLNQNMSKMVYDTLPLFDRKHIILKHIERLQAHSNHGSEHMQLRYTTTKKVGCVDGRQDNNKSDIGSLIGEVQLMNLMTDNNTDHISIVFHSDCGYILTAITLHRLFRALQLSISPDDYITMERALIFVNTLMTKPWVKRDNSLFREFMSHLDLNKVAKSAEEQKKTTDLLQSLITDNHGTLRYATSHMSDRGLFARSENGFPVMTALKNVEEAIEKHKVKMDESTMNMLIIEELVRLDEKSKRISITKNETLIRRRRLDSDIPSVEWMMEDFYSGRYFYVPQKMIAEQTEEEMFSTIRIDARTLKPFDLVLDRSCIMTPSRHRSHRYLTTSQDIAKRSFSELPIPGYNGATTVGDDEPKADI